MTSVGKSMRVEQESQVNDEMVIPAGTDSRNFWSLSSKSVSTWDVESQVFGVYGQKGR